MSSEYCVICGAEIPEGRQVCHACEPKVKEALLICSENAGDTPCMSCPLFMSSECSEDSGEIFENMTKSMRKEKRKMSMYIFPAILILLDVGAAVMCLIGKDYKKAVYWLAAAVLNVCVTI